MRRTLAVLLLLACPSLGQTPPPGPAPAPIPAPVPVPPPAPVPVPTPIPAPAPAPILPQAIVTSDHSDPVLPGVLVVLDGTRSIGDDVGWDSDSDEATYRVDSGGKILYFSAPTPGVYRFKLDAYGIANGKVKVSKARATITVIGNPEPPPTPVPAPAPDPGPAPVPVPIPIPVPPPGPAPVAGHLHVTLFYDVADPGAATFRYSAIKQQLQALDCDWYMVPTTSPIAQLFDPYLAGVGHPAIFFQDSTYQVLKPWTMKAPGSVADVIAQVKLIRGAK